MVDEDMSLAYPEFVATHLFMFKESSGKVGNNIQKLTNGDVENGSEK